LWDDADFLLKSVGEYVDGKYHFEGESKGPAD
jgi:hypothetical protein